MGILHFKNEAKDEKTIDFHLANSKNLLLIFTRNPELGKCKTRLAAKTGNEAALEIYTFLLNHTVEITKGLFAKKIVYYSEEIWKDDIWDNDIFEKRIQKGADLGERMANAFQDGFEQGFERIIIIGSDMYDISELDIQTAFEKLGEHNYVIGPAEDGGYYLLGMRKYNPNVFKNKDWGKETVLKDTLSDLATSNLGVLPTRNDVDLYEDIKDIAAFEPYLKHIQK